jgi:hypothetical protein
MVRIRHWQTACVAAWMVTSLLSCAMAEDIEVSYTHLDTITKKAKCVFFWDGSEMEGEPGYEPAGVETLTLRYNHVMAAVSFSSAKLELWGNSYEGNSLMVDIGAGDTHPFIYFLGFRYLDQPAILGEAVSWDRVRIVADNFPSYLFVARGGPCTEQSGFGFYGWGEVGIGAAVLPSSAGESSGVGVCASVRLEAGLQYLVPAETMPLRIRVGYHGSGFYRAAGQNEDDGGGETLSFLVSGVAAQVSWTF